MLIDQVLQVVPVLLDILDGYHLIVAFAVNYALQLYGINAEVLLCGFKYYPIVTLLKSYRNLLPKNIFNIISTNINYQFNNAVFVDMDSCQ